jgi:hypothetical protein
MAKAARKGAELQVMLNKARKAKYYYRTCNNISLTSVTESHNEFGDGDTVVSVSHV